MDAALHPESRSLDDLPTRHRGGGHRRLMAVGVGINPGRTKQIAVAPVAGSALEPDTWTRR